ncbi:hypothetical protein [Streptomyces sp. NPDC002346]
MAEASALLAAGRTATATVGADGGRYRGALTVLVERVVAPPE